VIDCDGFRPNVGIILSNQQGQVLWAKRIGQDAWQFPQGGINFGETPEQALYRELNEEIGLAPEHVEVMGYTQQWLYYHLPDYLIRRHKKPLCIGQKQRWYILRFIGEEKHFCLDDGNHRPEFDNWRWVDYWHPLQEVVFFKRLVYKQALQEFAALIPPEYMQAEPKPVRSKRRLRSPYRRLARR